MISRHVIYCEQCPDSAVETGSNARERKPATVSHEIALNLCGAPPDTPPFASYSVHTQTEVEATLAIGFSGKGSIVSLVWLDILDRRPSRKRCCFQCASINLLERENVHRIATKESPCADVIAIQFARCQIKYCKTKRTCY